MTQNICQWCKLQPAKPTGRFCSKLCKNRYISSRNDYKEISRKLQLLRPKITIKYLCKYCCNMFTKNIRSKQIFCSHSCAATYSNTHRSKDVYKRQSETLKYKLNNGPIKRTPRTATIHNKICPTCSKNFQVKRTKKKIYCSKECRPQYIRSQEIKDTLASYRRQCKFTFGLASYPDRFNFDLIKKHGFYSPQNKKNNLGGVSRDHMYSVRDGFDNKVSPELIKHPANCQLLIHSKNISKNKKSSITLEELKERIENWNKT